MSEITETSNGNELVEPPDSTTEKSSNEDEGDAENDENKVVTPDVNEKEVPIPEDRKIDDTAQDCSIIEVTDDGDVSPEEHQHQEKKKKHPYRIVDCFLYKFFLVFLYWAIFFGCGFGVSAISVSITDYHDFLNDFSYVSMSVVSLIFMIRSIAFLFSGYILGLVCERAKNPSRLYHLNLHHIAGIGAFFLSFPLALFPLIPISWLNLGFHFFLGIGSNTILITTVMLPKALFKSKKMTFAVVQGCHFCFGMGAFIYPLIIGSTVFTFDWSSWVNLVTIFYGALFFQAIGGIVFFLPAPVFDREMVEERKKKRIEKWKAYGTRTDVIESASVGNASETSETKVTRNKSVIGDFATKILRKILRCCDICKILKSCYDGCFLKRDIAKCQDIFCPSKTKDDQTQETEYEESEYKNLSWFRKILVFLKYKRRQAHFLRFLFIFLCSLSMVLYNSQNKSFQNLIFLYSKNRGWAKSTAAYTNTVYFVCYSFSRFVAMFLSFVVDPYIMIFFYEFGSLVTITLMNFFSEYDLVIWICVGFVALFNSPVFGALVVLPRSFGIEPSALENSLILTGSGVGSLLPSLVSVLMEENNRLFLVCVNVIALLMFTCYYVTYMVGSIYRNRKKKKLERLKKMEEKESFNIGMQTAQEQEIEDEYDGEREVDVLEDEKILEEIGDVDNDEPSIHVVVEKKLEDVVEESSSSSEMSSEEVMSLGSESGEE